MNIIAGTETKNYEIVSKLEEWFSFLNKLPGGEFVGRLVAGVLIFIVGWIFVKIVVSVIKKLLWKTELDNKLGSLVGMDDGAGIENTIAGLLSAIGMLFVLLLSLEVANLTQVTEPIKEILSTIVGAVPRILKAGLFLFIAFFAAKVVRTLVDSVLNAVRLDARLGNTESTPIANAISIAVFCFVLLAIIPEALEALDMTALSDPLKQITAQITSIVPKILLAGVLVAIGVMIAQIAQKLVKNVLIAIGADAFPGKIGLDVPQEGSRSVSSVVSFVVFLSILVLLISSALDLLNIPLLQKAASGFVGGYFNVLLAVIIFGGGLLGANFAYKALGDKNLILAKVARIAIIALTAVVALDRSGLAPQLTGAPFLGVVIALCFAGGVGGAIAIGLGGKDTVASYLEKKSKGNSSTKNY